MNQETAAQIESCLKSTATTIDALNPSYAGKLGVGRIDAAAAMKCVLNGIRTPVINFSVNENSIHVFPNPANNGQFQITFNSEQKNDYTIELKNILGQIIYTEKLPSFSETYEKRIDIGAHGKGIYFMTLNTNHSIYTAKIRTE